MSQKIDGVQVGKRFQDFPFTPMPHFIERGGHGLNTVVLSVIMGHGECWASIPTLAKEVGCSPSFIEKAIKYWETEGPQYGVFLEKEQGNKKGGRKTNTIRVQCSFVMAPTPQDDLRHIDGGNKIPPYQERGYLRTRNVGTYVPGTYKEEPLKKNIIKKIHTNNHAPDGAGGGDDVNQIFKVFYENGSPGIKYGNKTLRKDAQWLIDQFGLEETTRLAEVACNIQGKQYAPTIANPTQLREKLSSLQAFVARSISKDANRAPSFIETM